MNVKLKDIFKGIKYESKDDLSRVRINDIVVDSRLAGKGSLFVAIKGYSVDGHEFIGDVIKAGAGTIAAQKNFKAPGGIVKILVMDTRKALSVMAANFYSYPSDKLKVVGVTGTNGKTTVTYLLESIIRASGQKAGVIGTVNYRVGKRSIPALNTTPGILQLQSLFSSFVREGASYAVMEVSSHSLDQGRVGRILLDAAIITNVTPDHLDYHKTGENYFKAKAKLLGMLKKDGSAILNADDKRAASLKRSCRSKCLTYGIEKRADVSASGLNLSSSVSSFTVTAPGYRLKLRSALIGHHNVSNILAAITAAHVLKIDQAAIKKGIESFRSVPGRLEAIHAGQPFRVFVDFAHTEDALLNVLTILRKIASKRIITIFGCGGNRDRTKRPKMGRLACEMSDAVFLTSDNPRFEDPAGVISEIESDIKGKFSNYHIEPDRKDAIAMALGMARKSDIVLIAGKGHERYQIIGDRKIPFDDRRVARLILASLGKKGRPC